MFFQVGEERLDRRNFGMPAAWSLPPSQQFLIIALHAVKAQLICVHHIRTERYELAYGA